MSKRKESDKFDLNIFFLCVIACVFIASFALLAISYLTDSSNIWSFYALNLRGSLFTGFLSIGGFLLALKTFVVVKMKEGIYDHPKYKERLKRRRVHNPNLSAYGPLRRLSRLLFLAIFSSLTNSGMQFTVGLFNSWISAYLCIGMSIFTLSVLFLCLWQVRVNLNVWFDSLEEFSKEDQMVEG